MFQQRYSKQELTNKKENLTFSFDVDIIERVGWNPCEMLPARNVFAEVASDACCWRAAHVEGRLHFQFLRLWEGAVEHRDVTTQMCL